MQTVRESLWLPAAVLAVGVALVFAVLSAADRPTPAHIGPSAYPTPSPCLFLPVIRLNSGAGQAADNAFQIAPAATPYPPPFDVCGLKIPLRIYLPIIQRS